MKLLLIILASVVSSKALAFSDQQLLKDRFAKARPLAAQIVRETAVGDLLFPHLPDAGSQARVRQWYQDHQEKLDGDIEASKHIWEAVEQDSCGKTAHQRNAKITFAEAVCESENYTLLEAAKLLIGESAHHFPQSLNGKLEVVGDEFSDWVKRAVVEGWLAKGKPVPEEDPENAEETIAPGIYQSTAYQSLLLVSRNMKFNLQQDPYAYKDVEVSYNVTSIPGNPNGMLQQVQPIDAARANPQGVEDQTFRKKTEGVYESLAVMAFTGQMVYRIGPARPFWGPYYCEVGIKVRARPLQESKVMNVTILRPAAIQPKGCRRSKADLEEHIGFVRLGTVKGLAE